MDDNKDVTIEIPSILYKQFEEMAKNKGVSVDEMIQTAMELYIQLKSYMAHR